VLEATEEKTPNENGQKADRHGRADVAIAAALALANLGVLILCWRIVGIQADESINISGALRILDGERIYRDFWIFNTPGIFFWTAAIFSVLGKSLFAVRIVLILTTSAATSALYLLGRKFMGRAFSLISPLLFIMVGVNLWPVGSHHWYSTLLLVFSTFFMARFAENPTREKSLVCGGFLAGLTFLFQQPKGGPLLILLFLFLMVDTFLKKRESPDNSAPLRTLLLFVVGAGAPFFIIMIYFVWAGTLFEAVSATIGFPLRMFLEGGGEGGYAHFYGALTRNMIAQIVRLSSFLGAAEWAVSTVVFLINYAAPISIPVVVVLWLMQRIRGGAENSIPLLCSAAALAALIASLQKPDFYHLVSTSAPCYITLAAVLQMIGGHAKATKRNLVRKAPAVVFALVLIVSCARIAVADLAYASRITIVPMRSPLGFIPIRGNETDALNYRDPLMSTVTYIELNTGEDEKIFTASFSPFIYYLSDRKNATKYLDISSSPCGEGSGFHVFNVGGTPANLERLQAAVKEVDADKTRVIVLDPAISCKVGEQTDENAPPGDPLVEYIREHYRIAADYGVYVVMTRSD